MPRDTDNEVPNIYRALRDPEFWKRDVLGQAMRPTNLLGAASLVGGPVGAVAGVASELTSDDPSLLGALGAAAGGLIPGSSAKQGSTVARIVDKTFAAKRGTQLAEEASKLAESMNRMMGQADELQKQYMRLWTRHDQAMNRLQSLGLSTPEHLSRAAAQGLDELAFGLRQSGMSAKDALEGARSARAALAETNALNAAMGRVDEERNAVLRGIKELQEARTRAGQLTADALHGVGPKTPE